MASKESSLKTLTAGAVVVAALAVAALLLQINRPFSRRPIIIIRGFQLGAVAGQPFVWTFDGVLLNKPVCRQQGAVYHCRITTTQKFDPSKNDGTALCLTGPCTVQRAVFETNVNKKIQLQFVANEVLIESDAPLESMNNGLIVAYGDYSGQTIGTKESPTTPYTSKTSTFVYLWPAW